MAIAAPLSLQIASWREQRYAETGNGCYALAAIERALRASGRIEEPWLLGYMADVAAAVLKGALSPRQREPNDSLGDTLAKIMRLNHGKGKDPVEKARIDIRNHTLYRGYKDALLAHGGRKKDAIHEAALSHDLKYKTAANIISRIERTLAPPAK
jgi:hypothetical protein